MAYAERRGDAWRVRYKRPDGRYESASQNEHGRPFTDKSDALAYGRAAETDIARSQWHDPAQGDITLAGFAASWLGRQDLARNTMANLRTRLEVHILPDWGTRTLASIRADEVDTWERRLRDRHGYQRSTTASLRGTLSVLLSDAVTAGCIVTNPATRRHRRGKMAGRKTGRGPQRAWPAPLQALLISERMGILGTADDFVMGVTMAYTGLRFAEAVGLEREFVKLPAIHVEWQLVEVGGKLYREPPKDDSYRNEANGNPVDLPPFLAGLLSGQVQRARNRVCPCVAGHGGTGRYLFLGPRGGHHHRGHFSERRFRPAADGVYPGRAGNRPRPPRPVLVDATRWPGAPLQPWPYAVAGEPFTPPAGRGRAHLPDDVPLASWLPILPGLVPHAYGRHAHKVWMDEDGIPEILKAKRLGHEVPGIRGVYAHVSPAMRAQLTDALQRRWETSLAERAGLDPHSQIPALDELLAPYRARPAGRPRIAGVTPISRAGSWS